MEPHFGGRGGRKKSAMAPFERAMVVSYRLSIVTVGQSVTDLRSKVSDTQINRGGSLWAQISGCSPWRRSMMFGSAESKRPTLTNREIIFEEYQAVWSQSTNVKDRQTDGQTTCDRKTAHCTKAHCAVKTNWTLRAHVLFITVPLCLINRASSQRLSLKAIQKVQDKGN